MKIVPVLRAHLDGSRKPEPGPKGQILERFIAALEANGEDRTAHKDAESRSAWGNAAANAAHKAEGAAVPSRNCRLPTKCNSTT